MKVISATKIKAAVSELCIQANTVLRADILSALKSAYSRETNKRARNLLKAIIDNADIAQKEKLALCQDTGLPVVFLKVGQEVKVRGDLRQAINKGIEEGYKRGSLRNSIINNPLTRGRPGYAPAVVHTEIVRGNKLEITVLPKGFGCENKTQLRMFNPTAEISEIEKFIVDTVRMAGVDACPPYILGIGIGGTADYAMFLAKKALLKSVVRNEIRNTKYEIRTIERSLLTEINQLNIGPMGLGGKTTCLGVNIETYPTHIAGLPVAVNISCHALRSARKVL